MLEVPLPQAKRPLPQLPKPHGDVAVYSTKDHASATPSEIVAGVCWITLDAKRESDNRFFQFLSQVDPAPASAGKTPVMSNRRKAAEPYRTFGSVS
ncbi:hypothetical protein H7H51_09640 [Mycolicibacterium farcinogenes]|nr:hypothetical protein [Mycolicibacterium farcinogenes]